MRDDLRGPRQRGQGRTGALPLQSDFHPEEEPAQSQVDLKPDEQVGSAAWPFSGKPEPKPKSSRSKLAQTADRRAYKVLEEPRGQGGLEHPEEEPQRPDPGREEEPVQATESQVRRGLRTAQPRASQETRSFRR